MKRSDTDDLWTKIESLQWVLFVIFATKNGNMVIFDRLILLDRKEGRKIDIIFQIGLHLGLY